MADSEKRFIGHLNSFESSFAVDSVDFQNLLAAAFLAVPFRALCFVCFGHGSQAWPFVADFNDFILSL